MYTFLAMVLVLVVITFAVYKVSAKPKEAPQPEEEAPQVPPGFEDE